MQFLGPKNRSVSSSTTYMDRDHGTYKATITWKMCRACERNMFFLGEAMQSSFFTISTGFYRFLIWCITVHCSSWTQTFSKTCLIFIHFPWIVSIDSSQIESSHCFFYAVGLSRPFWRWGDVANSVFRYQCSKDSTSRQIHEVQGGVDHPSG